MLKNLKLSLSLILMSGSLIAANEPSFICNTKSITGTNSDGYISTFNEKNTWYIYKQDHEGALKNGFEWYLVSGSYNRVVSGDHDASQSPAQQIYPDVTNILTNSNMDFWFSPSEKRYVRSGIGGMLFGTNAATFVEVGTCR